MAKSSPTTKTLSLMRAQGYTCAIVEKYNHHIKITQDLYGFIDVLGVGPDGTLAVQTTTTSNFSSRWKKITGQQVPKSKKEEDQMLKVRENVISCLNAGWVIEVHGWDSKQPSKEPRIEQITFEHLTDPPIMEVEKLTDGLPF